MAQIPFTGSPVFNAARTLPGFEAGRAAVRSRDAVQVLEFFAKLPDSGTRNFAYTVLGGFYDMADYEQRETDAFLADCAYREQGSTTLRILYANRLIRRGWAVRGEGRARAVSREQFAYFHEQLVRAEEVLRRVTAEYPGDVNAWTTRMLTARGLEASQDQARLIYERAITAEPNHLPAQSQHLQKLAPKWGGSWDAMFSFASACALNAPAGTSNAVLVAEAHLERWLVYDRLQRDNYMRRRSVRQEIYAAAERSVLDPSYGTPFDWVTVRSTFAAVLCLTRHWSAARAQFDALGDYASRYPWMYMPYPERHLRAFRRIARRRARIRALLHR